MPAPAPPEPPTAQILSALHENAHGNPLPYLRLLHHVSATTAQTPALLNALSHLPTHLHTHTHAPALRALFDAALALPHPLPPDALPPYTALLHNLLSADAAYIEPTLHTLARRAFLLPPPHHAALLAHLLPALRATLAAHPRADALLAAVLARRYPHPVRPAAEHAAYLQTALALARALPGPVLPSAVLRTALERLAAVDALVPLEVRALDGSLCPEADKVQLMLAELFAHLRALQPTPAYPAHLASLQASYAAAVVPVDGARYAPSVLLHAASLAGPAAVSDAAAHLTAVFRDPSAAPRLRERFLAHAAALVARARLLAAPAAFKWVSELAAWLNRYVDAVERGRVGVVDVDVHHLFYAAASAYMLVVTARRDALREGGVDSLDAMRVFRVMACSLNPLLVLPEAVVTRFVKVVRVEGMELGEIVEENRGRYTPSRTRYGGKNRFVYREICPEIELEGVREGLKGFLREECDGEEPDEDSDEEDDDGDDDGIVNDDNMVVDFDDAMDNVGVDVEGKIGFMAGGPKVLANIRV